MDIIKPNQKMIYPDDWPPRDYFVQFNKVTPDQLGEFRKLLQNSAEETQINEFLKNNPEVLVNILDFLQTGYHGAWIVHQQIIRPPQPEVQKGLKPDMIIGGKNSDGFSWCILDLKGSNEALFTESNNNLRLSSVANKGIIQVLEYIDYCAYAQNYLRDTLKLTNFREPKGLILLGREEEFNNNIRRQDLKAAWNGHSTIKVRTYDSLLRTVERVVENYSK